VTVHKHVANHVLSGHSHSLLTNIVLSSR